MNYAATKCTSGPESDCEGTMHFAMSYSPTVNRQNRVTPAALRRGSASILPRLDYGSQSVSQQICKEKTGKKMVHVSQEPG